MRVAASTIVNGRPRGFVRPVPDDAVKDWCALSLEAIIRSIGRAPADKE